jgi:hypothetical protein
MKQIMIVFLLVISLLASELDAAWSTHHRPSVLAEDSPDIHLFEGPQPHQLCARCLTAKALNESQIEKSSPRNPQPLNIKNNHCAITYKLESWRRLGDNIITYCKAKLLSLIYNIPLFYKPFPYSDEFVLHNIEILLTPEIEKNYETSIPVHKISELEEGFKSGKSILFESHFLTETPWLYSYSREHPEFEKEIKSMLTLITPFEPLSKPENVVPVALHVRKGGGYDSPLASKQEYKLDDAPLSGIYLKKNSPPNSCTDIWPIKWPIGPNFIDEVTKFVYKKNHFSDYTWPIKFPCDQYYIDHLRYLSNFLKDRQLLVYLFTDDPNPETIMQRYSQALADCSRIIFSYRQKDNHHTKNVLHDLFAIIQCDCLISASSSFAHVAQLLGNHSILIMPLHAITLPDKIIMNKVAVFGMNNAYDLENRKLFYNELIYKLK